MPVTIIVGGQFGSEGKGKVAHYFARETSASIAVRVGGPNSGHTAINSSGEAVILRQLPTAALLPDIICVLSAGSYISIETLIDELELTHLSSDRLVIDPNAVIITEREQREERESTLRSSIGSTLSGTGAAVSSRVARTSTVRLAKDERLLQRFVKPAVPLMRQYLDDSRRIIIEGTQGFGLSVLHSSDYPFATSRDTTAAGFLSEVGLSPLDVDQVILVLRAFPIRVAGNSGPLPREIDWETISLESGSVTSISERTSVTQVIRRVARFHPHVVRQAIMVNRPTHIVLNHLDYIDSSCYHTNAMSEKTNDFVNEIEGMIDESIDYFGFNPISLVSRV